MTDDCGLTLTLRYFGALRRVVLVLAVAVGALMLPVGTVPDGIRNPVFAGLFAIQVTSYLAAGGLFVVALYRRLVEFNAAAGLRAWSSPHRMLVAFGSPLLNLYAPYFIVRTLWQAGGGGAEPRLGETSRGLLSRLVSTASERSILVWWCGHVAYCVAATSIFLVFSEDSSAAGAMLMLGNVLVLVVASAGMGLLCDLRRHRASTQGLALPD
jgi:hypothetical protein